MADVTNNDVTPDEEAYRSELAQEFGRRLREARLKTFPKPRQRDWALLMGLTDVRQYQRWEHGEQLPSLERLPKIIEVSGIDVSDLFETPGGMTRDGLKSYFDERMNALEERMIQMLTSNFHAIQEGQNTLEANFMSFNDRLGSLRASLGELRAVVDARLPGDDS